MKAMKTMKGKAMKAKAKTAQQTIDEQKAILASLKRP